MLDHIVNDPEQLNQFSEYSASIDERNNIN